MKTLIEYDGMEFRDAKELENYLKLQATINGHQIVEEDIQGQVVQIIESSLIEEDMEENDDMFVSLESLQEEENYFDDYDMESERELDFN